MFDALPELKIDSLDLQIVLALARTGSQTEVADALGCTQSAISQRVKRLESCLNGQLFARHTRHLLIPTDLGMALVLCCESVQQSLDYMMSLARTGSPEACRAIVAQGGFNRALAENN